MVNESPIADEEMKFTLIYDGYKDKLRISSYDLYMVESTDDQMIIKDKITNDRIMQAKLKREKSKQQDFLIVDNLPDFLGDYGQLELSIEVQKNDVFWGWLTTETIKLKASEYDQAKNRIYIDLNKLDLEKYRGFLKFRYFAIKLKLKSEVVTISKTISSNIRI